MDAFESKFKKPISMRRSSYSEAVRYRDTRSRYGQALDHERSRARRIKLPYLLAAIFILAARKTPPFRAGM